jgi:hypothetical protein
MKILAGDRIKVTLGFIAGDDLREERIVTVARVEEHHAGANIWTSAGDEIEAHYTWDTELISRPVVPWMEGMEIEAIVTPDHVKYSREVLEFDIGHFDGLIVRWRPSPGRVNRWTPVRPLRESDPPFDIVIDDLGAGHITNLPFSYSQWLNFVAISKAEEPLEPWNGLPWETVTEVNRWTAHYERAASWNVPVLWEAMKDNRYAVRD